LTEVSSIPLQQSLKDLETAYSNFFASCKGERKGKKVKPPKFKKRKSKQSARFTDNGFTVNQHHVTLAKIGDLKVVWSRPLSVISYQLSVISYQLSVISYQLSVISYQLSVISYQLISYQLSVISYQLSVISYQLSVISYQLSVISYQV